jgi:hypothetical protein
MADRTSGRAAVDMIARTVREVGHRTPAPTREDRVSHLVAARELERFDLGADRVDIRRWGVLSSDGRPAGVVDRLLVETATGRVRYVSVVLAPPEGSEKPAAASGSVLVPVGSCRSIADRRLVVLDDITNEDLARAPRLPRRAITRADEDATLAAYGVATSHEIPPGQMYTRPHFDERRLLATAE